MNYLVSRYSFVDRLLDSSIVRDLLEDYDHFQATTQQNNLQPITEESAVLRGNLTASPSHLSPSEPTSTDRAHSHLNERSPLLVLSSDADDEDDEMMDFSQSSKERDARHEVMVAIYINLTANVILLVAKIVVTLMTSSVSVLASLVDGALDFLSTAIVWGTTRLTVRRDRFRYPVGRQRLEPLGVLIFSVVMITSFFQVAILSGQRLLGKDHELVELTVPVLIIMASTVAVKGLSWLWCRGINNSNVQALAQDAITDVIFNIFSIIFPLSKSRTATRNATCISMATNTVTSWYIHEHLVFGSSGRSSPLMLCDWKLGQYRKRAHRPPDRSRCIAY